ncbi:pyruvate dehydrogenase complex transcriptional repressor PdhR [Celerinatantimonas diazotrophica]|uniref:Pyruvate dehydrogenase complex repressor n=1 Tax=Celerinatantimonas diazotrophica TaxID=412034 RepID=A0A4R1K2R0_9GAMM|nr:pyruvate dehydrogenase complex transcriptional repressor PdhR [Celerinatantimonas diazotrophica]TCK57983.1 GntR family transcriptional regulator [Celerinatantimonas diazotrophica]CAG9297948.1 Pyruvate dehydrogenase complex repressor [Celerinatantimonas diazotrophica]
MTYPKVKHPKLSDLIVHNLETMILEGSFRPGQRLPAERELARQFDVSRPSLREAIQKLEAKGLVIRKQGGGTYVQQDLREGLTDPLFQLLSDHPEGQLDLLEFRHAFEGIAAYYAALRGTEADFEQINDCHAHIAMAQNQGNVEAESEAVMDFYEAIANASHNMVFLHLIRGLRPLLLQNILHNFKILYIRTTVAAKITQHRQLLLNAIVQRQPAQARDASYQHLAFIEETLLDIGRESSRIERSLRRSEQF